MLDKILSLLSIEVFFAALSVLIAWLIYRKQLIDERKRIIASIGALLKMAGKWFDSEYDKNHENKSWYRPSLSVYPVDVTQVSNILTSNLLNIELSKYLSYFIQLVRRFNHRIEDVENYRYSEPHIFKEACLYYQNELKDLDQKEILFKLESLKDNKDELLFYFEHLYALQKNVHVDGIGKGDFDYEIPSLNKCYRKIECLFEIENRESNGLLKGKLLWILSDIVFILMPVGIILLSLLRVKNYL